MTALVVGCGDTGSRIALALLATGVDVTGLVRSADSARGLHAQGIDALAADLDARLPPLPAADLVFYCAPPPPEGEGDPRLARLLAALARAPARLVYIGTSGVYGDCGGAWVNEDTPIKPQTARAQRRAAAEAQLKAWGPPIIILRAPGLYGPGRLPITRLRAGEPVLADADSPWTNRIHVQDLAECAVAAATRDHAGFAVYNAADGQPTKAGALPRALARRLRLPAPREIDWATAEQLWPATRLSFLRESRRLDNRRLLAMLGRPLRYPDLDAGLDASLTSQ